jgi:hypothetical protein
MHIKSGLSHDSYVWSLQHGEKRQQGEVNLSVPGLARHTCTALSTLELTSALAAIETADYRCIALNQAVRWKLSSLCS